MKHVSTSIPPIFPLIGHENGAPLGGDQLPPLHFGDKTKSALSQLELQNQIRLSSRQDVRLGIKAIILIIVLATSLILDLVTEVAQKRLIVNTDFYHLPHLMAGTILIVTALFIVYATAKKHTIDTTRTYLIEELLNNERRQAFSLLDPVTQLLSYRTIDNIAEREIARANRLGSALTFVAINLDSISLVQKHAGIEARNRALVDAARVFTNTFRGSDAIFRLGPTQFLVLMPDTTERQAESAVARLKSITEALKIEGKQDLGLAFSYGVSPHIVGRDKANATEQVRRCMFLLSQKANVF